MNVAGLIWLAAICPVLAQDTPLRGFSAAQARIEHEWEDRAHQTTSAAQAGEFMRKMSAEPHHAGSPGSRVVANYALQLLQQWGYQAGIETFEGLMPYPTHRQVEMVAPVKFRARLEEPSIKEDPDTSVRNQLPPYNAYAASGDVTATLVYVNYGVPEDYEYLKKIGVDVRGKIVIARYGGSWRGVKPKIAAEHGAVACLIYSDPKDDGYFAGDVYPKGPYRPALGVQRGSVIDMALYPGDPLSPGWASEPGARRLALKDATTLMKIPVQPLSYEDAKPLLANLSGNVAPQAWRGALPMTYHIGPGPASVHVKLKFDFATRPVYNVIAKMPGDAYPGQWVIYGNHHDAWVNGGSDPASGAAALLEAARTLGELHRQGWKPKRTVVFALWDAEEFGLIGSTEWVEKNLLALQAKTVAYFNSDSNGKGTFAASGSPALEVFFEEIARDVKDPVTGKSLQEYLPPANGSVAPFRMGPMGAGSDYVAFTHHAGIAGANIGFSGAGGGVYHSLYDTFHWYTRFADKDFLYSRALAQVSSSALMRMAGAQVVPFEYGRMVRALRAYLSELETAAGVNSGKLQLGFAAAEVNRLDSSARRFEESLRRLLARPPLPELGEINQAIYQVERAMLSRNGLPGRPWYKHVMSAPGMYTGYGAKTLPGIREAMEAGNFELAAREARILGRALHSVNSRIEAVIRSLDEAGVSTSR